MIKYWTNWMGPINPGWIEEHGDNWAAGRIDIWDTKEPYNDEMGLPVMKVEDWCRFGEWIRVFETDTVWTLKELVAEYEKTNPKITWWKNDQN